LELDPKNPAPYAPLSMALRALGDFDGAAATFRAMIDLAPTAAIGYVGLARTLTGRGDDVEVVRTLAVAEQFMGELRSFRLDAALSYANAGRQDDAARPVAEFMAQSAGYRIDPALAAMAALALGNYEQARTDLAAAVTARATGVDPLPLEQIRRNTWSNPVLDEPEWQQLRASLAWR
jgi:tetratricopeptide (TPR) repeat protein